MSGSYTLQILHGSDFEAGLQAAQRADRFAAIVDRLEDAEANSITLSAGDNFIPGPFSAASGDPAVRTALQGFYTWLLQADPSTLTGLREAVGRMDVAVLNGIGVQASAIGNHDLDFGTTIFADAVDMTASGGLAASVGAMFPYLSANLDFSGDPALRSLYTATLRNAASYATTATDLAGPAALAAEAADQQIAPWTTIQEGGQTIGVLAVTTQLEAQLTSIGGVTVRDPAGDGGIDNMDELAGILQPLINQMTAQGINKVVLLSHLQQYTNELQLAAKLSGVDVIVAGGSHAIFADGTDRLRIGDAAEQGYPQFITAADGSPVAVVSTGNEYSYVGRLVATFDENGVIQRNSVSPAVSGAYATTDENVMALWGSADPYAEGTRGGEVRQLLAPVAQVINSKDGTVFGQTKVYLEGRRGEVRTEETNLGSLSSDANLSTARQVDGEVAVSFKNGGGIRAEIGALSTDAKAVEIPPQANPAAGKPEGGISQLDIENSLRFNNSLSIVTVTAEKLERLLEHSVAAVAPGATPGSFGQWGGVAFTYDPNGTAQVTSATNGNVITEGTRIRSAAILNDDGSLRLELVRDGTLVGDANAAIKLTTLSYLAEGGDSYPLQFYYTSRIDLLNNPNLPEGISSLAVRGSEQDAFAEYMAALHNGPYTAYGLRDVGASQDARVQNLALRSGDVTQETVQGVGDINGSSANQLLLGSAGNDTFHASAGRDTVRGQGGDDVLDFGGTSRAGGGLLEGTSGILSGFAWTDAAVGSSSTFFSGINTVRFADAEISFSSTSIAAKVDQLYRLFHGGADPVGQAYWTDVIKDGDAGAGAMATAFLANDPALAATDDSGFIGFLYNGLLGRDAEAGSQAFWMARINEFGRAQVVQDIAGSEEAGIRLSATAAKGVVFADFDALLVSEAYKAVLGRDVEAKGLESWTAALDARQNLDQLVSGIIGSTEHALLTPQNDADFVNGLYQDVLGRTADTGGFANWTGSLAQGTSRAAVVTGFLLSAEGMEHLYQAATDGVLIA
jgi:2',3'-cyclic-nucleotide 2'-phosphodiesterase (5'-nucleotidase family)